MYDVGTGVLLLCMLNFVTRIFVRYFAAICFSGMANHNRQVRHTHTIRPQKLCPPVASNAFQFRYFFHDLQTSCNTTNGCFTKRNDSILSALDSVHRSLLLKNLQFEDNGTI